MGFFSTNKEAPVSSRLARISGQSVSQVENLFSKFEVDNKFRAHQNLIEDIPRILTNHGKDSNRYGLRKITYVNSLFNKPLAGCFRPEANIMIESLQRVLAIL